jgi:hypothetical protein
MPKDVAVRNRAVVIAARSIATSNPSMSSLACRRILVREPRYKV